MTYVGKGGDALEYYPCRYGLSRVQFRGPRRRLQGDYIAFLGGTDTYGRFIEEPFPALTEQGLSVPCVNFGSPNAGLDLYLNDPTIMQAAEGAAATVIQVMGAQNMSNRYYAVHPRRNDRFLRASRTLQAIYPEVDFTEFHFTRHMLTRLRDLSEDRFGVMVAELRAAWTARMKLLVGALRGPIVLLWFADQPPPDTDATDVTGDPLFITAAMVEVLRPRVAGVVIVCPSEQARAEGTQGMIYDEFDASAAQGMIGPRTHQEAAAALCPVLQDMLSRHL